MGTVIDRPRDGRIRPVVRLGHPVLRERAQAVGPERFGTRFLRDLGRDLLRTMFEESGVGLAAPQIAVPLRVFSYYVPGEGDRDEVEPRVLVNPVLTALGEPTEPGWEGCLSIPGMRGMVPRYAAVHVEARDTDGQALSFDATGFHARVIQHENDHLDGIMFVDRMRDMSTLTYEEEFEKYGAPSAEAIV